MKWPWVSRRAYDERGWHIAQLTADLTQQRKDAAAERSALLDKITSLQRQGFTAPAPLADAIPQPSRLPPKVEAAILARMDPTGSAARQTAQLAHAWLARGDTEDAVAALILQGAG